MLFQNGVLGTIDCGMINWICINITSIKILPFCIIPMITSRNSIWIKHRHYLKNKLVQQNLRLLIWEICQHIQYSLQKIWSRHLSTVNPSTQKDSWFIESLRLRDQLVLVSFSFINICVPSNCYELNWSFFKTVPYCLSVEVDILLAFLVYFLFHFSYWI